MAVPATKEDLFDLVWKSGLVDKPRFTAFSQQLQLAGDTIARPGDVAQLMIRQGLITHFQAEQLLLGRFQGFTLGKYRLLEKLGSGGMGTVYLAVHLHMRRRVALKVLPPDQCAKQASVERFYREARAAAALDHPNIARAYDVDSDGRLHFLVMEFIDGASLQDIVSRHGALSIPRALHYTRQAAQGLQHAHEQKLVHRDIKPGNLVLDRQGVVKILDMGLARFFEDKSDNLTRDLDGGNILGTADYIAPEQAMSSHDVDIRADIYSLGMTAYFLLAGKSPFGDATVTQKLLWQQLKQPKPIREVRPEVPEEVEAILQKMLQKEPKNRYQTPAEVVQALQPWTPADPPSPPPEEMPKLCPAALGQEPTGDLGSRTAITPRPAGMVPRAAPATIAPRGSPRAVPAPAPEIKRKRRKHGDDEDDKKPRRAARRQSVVTWIGSIVALAIMIGSIIFIMSLSQAAKELQSSAAGSQPSQPPQQASRPPQQPAAAAPNLKKEVRLFVEHTMPIESVAFTPDSKHLLTASWDKTLIYWDVQNGKKVRTLTGHTAEVHCVVCLPDGKRALSASWDKTIKLWDLNTGNVLKTLTGHTDKVQSVAQARDGSVAVSGSSDYTIRAWDVIKGEEFRKFEGHSQPVWSVAFSPDARQVLSGSYDNTVRLWEMSSGREIRRFEGHTARVNSVVFAKNGQWVLTGCDDKTVRIFEAGSGKPIRSMKTSAGVASVAFSADDRFILGGCVDGRLYMWQTDNGKELHKLDGKSAESIWGVAFAPDGRSAATGHKGKVAILWGP